MVVKIVLIAIVIIVLLVIFLYLLSINAGAKTTASRTPNGQAPSVDPLRFPLRQGMTTDEILHLQRALNQKNNAGLVTDGNFGAKTLAAVKKEFGTESVSYEQFKTLLTYMSR